MIIKEDFMNICECNPFLRAAMIQPAVLEGSSPRAAYDYRLFLILHGKGYIFLNGSKFELRENMLLCFAPKEEYYFVGKMKVAVLNFDMTRQSADRKHPIPPPPVEFYDPQKQFDHTRVTGLEEPLILPVDENLKSDVLEVVECFVRGGEFYDALCSALLKRLLVSILSLQNRARTATQQLCDDVLCYVKSNAAELTDNRDVAAVFGYHPFYLATIFKDEIGKPLHTVILEEKLKLACRWLRATNRSVEEISHATGFSSRNYFCTVFKRYYGISPLKYRKQTNSTEGITVHQP